ncbi:MAG TPA: PAS domain S-box protein, partial [Gemmatimonadales bacterium]
MPRSMVQRLNLSLAAGFGFVVILAGIAIVTSDHRLEAGLMVALVVIAGAASWFLRRAAIRDLERRADADTRLRESEARFSGILSIAANAIITTDRRLRVIHFNRAAEAMFGYPAGEIIGAPLATLLPAAAAARHDQYMAEFGRSSEPARLMGARGDVAGRRRSGEEFPAEVSISKLPTSDGLLFTAVVRDVTEERRTAHHEHTLAVAGARLAATLDYDATLRLVVELPVLAAGDWCLLDVVDADEREHPVLHRIASSHSNAG